MYLFIKTLCGFIIIIIAAAIGLKMAKTFTDVVALVLKSNLHLLYSNTELVYSGVH